MLQPKYTSWCGTVALKWRNTLSLAKFGPLRVNIHLWYMNGQNHKTTNVQTDRYDDIQGEIYNKYRWVSYCNCMHGDLF